MTRPEFLYLPSTPRHLLLCAALALREPAAGHHLYLVEHHSAASIDRYLEALAAWPGSPFASIERLEADYRRRMSGRVPSALRPLARIVTKHRLRRENRRRLAAAIARLAPARIYVGSDDFFETQFALYCNRRRDAAGLGIYVEDGTVAYQASFKDRGFGRLIGLRRLKAWAKKLTFGPWFRYVPVTGTSAYIDEAWLAFPEFAIAALRAKTVRPLPRDLFDSPAFAELGRQLAARFDAPLDALAAADVLVALTRSTVAKLMPGYVTTMSELIDRLIERGLRVAVKYHPREFAPEFIVLPRSTLVCVIPRELPFELLVAIPRDPRFSVIGDVSTVLLATRWQRPSARVLALRFATPGGDYLTETFAALGIAVEDSAAALCKKFFPVRPG